MDQWATPPTNATVPTSSGTHQGAPTVFWGASQDIVVTGCATTANPSYTVTFSDGSAPLSGAMTQGPAGTFKATLAPFYPSHGAATITTNVPADCDPGTPPTKFDVYIDPSGVVTDQYGQPINGATVTLFRSDTPGGTFTKVPDGSDIMSPDNQRNPDTTGPTLLDPTKPAGYFRWDVAAGYYKVKVQADNCTPYTTDTMPVPPPAIDLLLKMSCTTPAPAPTPAPSITGSPALGQTLSTQASVWAAPFTESAIRWLRDGVAISGATASTYKVVAADIGHKITVEHSAKRPAYVQDSGRGVPVSFQALPLATSAQVTVAKLGSSTSATPVKNPVSRRTAVKMVLKVVSGLSPTGKITVYRNSRAFKSFTMTAGARGKMTVSLGKFKKGKYRMAAKYLGNGQINGSWSRTVTMRVR
jgi:hypothetical protein